jgi:pimeloyl-ACP methyl ester carboxylesterase
MTTDFVGPWRRQHEGLTLTGWGSPPPTVLLIHGWGYDSRVWGKTFVSRLAAEMRVIAADWHLTGSDVCFAGIVGEIDKAAAMLDGADVVVAQREAAAAAVDLAIRGFTRGIVLLDQVADAVVEEVKEAEAELDESFPLQPIPDKDDYQDSLYRDSLAALSDFIAHPERGVDPLIEVTSRGFAQFVSADDVPLIRPIVEKFFHKEPPVLAVSEPHWVDRLREVPVPVLISWQHGASGYQEKALAARAPHGESVAVDMNMPLPWLESPEQIAAIIKRVLPKPT